MQSGLTPATHHDGCNWDTSDPLVEQSPLGYTAILIWVKRDWAELTKTLGLQGWQSWVSPCFVCNANQDDLHTYGDCNTSRLAWQDKQDGDYDTNCRSCEIVVVVENALQKAAILRSLTWMQGKRWKGRMLTCSPPGFPRLVADDRLEPSAELLDIGALANVRTPTQLTFWRAHRHTDTVVDCVMRRCPLFYEELGTTLSSAVVIDSLHAVYYGPLMRWVSAILWRVLHANWLGILGDAAMVRDIGLKRLSAETNQYLVDNEVPHDRRINELTSKQLGTDLGEGSSLHAGCLMKSKAAKIGTLVPFAVACLQVHSSVQHGTELLRAGMAMCRYLDLVRETDAIPTNDQCTDMLAAVLEHLHYCETAGIHFVQNTTSLFIWRRGPSRYKWGAFRK